MKNLNIVLAVLLITTSGFAQVSSNDAVSVMHHLLVVNKQWKKHLDKIPREEIAFTSDTERISYHLLRVEERLRKAPKDHLNEGQQRNRTHLLNELRLYANKKQFPTNLYHQERTPYFIDDFGVHCAVGYLIKVSGYGDLSLQISREHNYDFLADIKTPGITEWASEHGFSLDELAWIQPTYMGQLNYTSVGSGVNGRVNAMERDPSTDRIYFIGEYSAAGTTNCQNTGFIYNDAVYCMGDGLAGELVDIVVGNDRIFVTGAIEKDGDTYSYAIFENNKWSYHNVPNHEGKKALTLLELVDGSIEVALSEGDGLETTVWKYTNGTWSKLLRTSGAINSIAENNEKIVYGGVIHWYSVNNTDNGANHVVIREKESDHWWAPTGQAPLQVYKIKWIDGRFFFAGRGLNDYKSYALTTLHGDSLAALYSNYLVGNSGASAFNIYDIEHAGDQLLAISGNFWVSTMTYGYGAAKVDYSIFENKVGNPYASSTALYYPLGNLPSAPWGISLHESKCYVGGNLPSLNHIARYDFALSLDKKSDESIEVFPNPAQNFIKIATDNVREVVIQNVQGETVLKSSETTIDISALPAATYLITITNENGLPRKSRFVKTHN